MMMGETTRTKVHETEGLLDKHLVCGDDGPAVLRSHRIKIHKMEGPTERRSLRCSIYFVDSCLSRVRVSSPSVL